MLTMGAMSPLYTLERQQETSPTLHRKSNKSPKSLAVTLYKNDYLPTNTLSQGSEKK